MLNKFKELKVANDAMHDAQELRQRIQDDGYLFFKKLQNPDNLQNLRKQMMTVIRKGGWLASGTNPMDGIADLSQRCTEGDSSYTSVYHAIYKLQAFHQSGHWSEVLSILEKLTDKPVLPHPQKIARLWFPKYTEHTTPIHQDFVHFQGNFDTYTCWTPVGDCPIELGGLTVVPGSHKIDRVIDHHFSLGAGALRINEREVQGEWHTTNYEIGDTLFFLALTVHQALPNRSVNKLRVSLDNRYQAIGNPICNEVLTPHLHGYSPLSWDEVYRKWESEHLKYYWKDLVGTPDTPVMQKDYGYSEQGFKEALSLAKTGDKNAILHLERFIEHSPTSDSAKAAREALQART